MICSFQFSVLLSQAEQLSNIFSNVTFRVPLSLVSKGAFPHQSQTRLQQFSLFTSQPLPGHLFQYHIHKNIRLVTPKTVQPVCSSVSVKEKKPSVNRSVLKFNVHLYISLTNISTFSDASLLHCGCSQKCLLQLVWNILDVQVHIWVEKGLFSVINAI